MKQEISGREKEYQEAFAQYNKGKNKDVICGAIFAASLVAVVVGVMLTTFISAGPIVLGTEMNSNGSVEYLCLGRGCESYATMDW